ncbi:MAG TPA: deoxyribodipyrimidine photo-lyase [Acidimicrobiia bacterium]
MRALMWFRRDLRLADNPPLRMASSTGAVVPVFVIDPHLTGPSGAPRLSFLLRCLAALDESLGGHLVLRTGDPADQIPRLVSESDASVVFATADFGPYGRDRDAVVASRLARDRVAFELVESSYLVPPGTVTKADGTPYRVFTPFFRAWQEHAHDVASGPPPDDLLLVGRIASDPPPREPAVDAMLPRAGEAAGRERLAAFATGGIHYTRDRDRPDCDATSRLSPYLKFGCIHPRQVVDSLRDDRNAEEVRRQLAWREFYADVVYHEPRSTRHALQEATGRIRVDRGADADRRFDAWAAGRTGYPIVDAGMRQLAGEAWMHNRVRMIVASFLVKDLHLDWTWGARLFMQRLVDGDLASNSHGWQWVAGTGTDAAPYHRIFNPVRQGKRFDPNGDYVRRWIPELAGIDGPAVHEPWTLRQELAGYPAPIVDHAEQRREALSRYAAARANGGAAPPPRRR